MPGMTVELENNPSRPVARGASLANIAQTGVLLAGFGALLAAVLWPEFGRGAIFIALLAAAGIVVLATRVSPGSIMRIYGARPYQAGDLAQFDRIHERAGSPRRAPRRAAAFRRPEHAAQRLLDRLLTALCHAVTEGLLRRLTMREVAAVLAREVAHAQRGDLLVLGIADFVSRCAQGALLRRLGAGGPQHPARHQRRRARRRG